MRIDWRFPGDFEADVLQALDAYGAISMCRNSDGSVEVLPLSLPEDYSEANGETLRDQDTEG